MPVLTDDERDFVTELLTAQVVGNNAPRATLAQLLHESLREQLEVSGTGGFLAARTVEICILNDYTLQPPALCAVLEFLIDKTGDGRLPPLFGRLQRRIHQRGPTQARILANRLPFADRDGLRPMLSDMHTIVGAEPILLVRGDIESGKSYVSELVEHICIRSDEAVFCKFKVKTESQGRDATPKAIASDLVTQLGGDPNRPLPNQHTGTDAWLDEVANWVISNANAAAGGRARAWFVIDGLRDRVVLPDTARFLVKLAEKCALGVAAKRHRLLLSDFSEEHSGLLPIRMKRYRTEAIKQADVEAIVTEIIDASTQFPAADKPALVTEAVSTILEGLSPPLSSMTILGQRLQALIERAQL